MADETIELTEVQAIVDGLSSPTDEQFMQAVRGYSERAIGSAAAKLAMEGGGSSLTPPAQVQGPPGGVVGWLFYVLTDSGLGLTVLPDGRVTIESEGTSTPLTLVQASPTTQKSLVVTDNGGTDMLTVGLAGVMRVAGTDGGSRVRLGSVYAANPDDPPVGEADVMIVDSGAGQVLRVRYNDGGVIKVGDVALV